MSKLKTGLRLVCTCSTLILKSIIAYPCCFIHHSFFYDTNWSLAFKPDMARRFRFGTCTRYSQLGVLYYENITLLSFVNTLENNNLTK